jgi:hypothetical protein
MSKKNPAPVVVVTPPAPVPCGGCGGSGNAGSQYHPQAHGPCKGTGWVRV